MRRRDREITDREKMLEIVAECDCCRLGLVDNGEAYIVPMNFGFEDAGSALTLYFHCAAEGRKLDLNGLQPCAPRRRYRLRFFVFVRLRHGALPRRSCHGQR